MKKRKLFVFSGIGIVVVVAVLLFSLSFSKPGLLPPHHQLIEEMNNLFPKAAAHIIQDTVFIDEKHIYVPFRTLEGDYGKSFWVWKKNKWQVAYIDTKGNPLVWKIDRNDPSTFHIVWNMNPIDELESIHYYLIRNRGYRVTEGVEYYQPKVQMEQSVSLMETSYGGLQLPDDWVAFLDGFEEVELAKQPNPLFSSFFPEQYVAFGWLPYGKGDEETFPEHSVNGNSYSTGDVEFTHLMIMNEVDVE